MPGLDDFARENYENEVQQLQHAVVAHIAAKADIEKRLGEVLKELQEKTDEFQRLQSALKFEQTAHKESNKLSREQLDRVRNTVGFVCGLIQTLEEILPSEDERIYGQLTLIRQHLFKSISDEYHHSDIPF